MTQRRFEGEVVMITGAAGGFGAAAAKRFAEEGAALLLSDLQDSNIAELMDALPAGTKVRFDPVDVTSEAQVLAHIEQGVAELGPLDVAINNAGIGQALTPLQQTSEAEFDRIMAVNAKGVFNGMKAQLPGMIARGAGRILNVASAAGLVGSGHIAAYAASKHAVVGLTRSAADEAARHGVRVNALCPSFAPTPLFNDIADDLASKHGTDRGAAYGKVTGRIPMRRLAEVEEVVQAMLWAVSPENSFMTGQTISIDGGLSAV